VKLYGAPDFVKSASTDRIQYTNEDKNPNAFADKVNLQFPCHNAPSTYVSMMFLLDNEEKMGTYAEVVKDRIMKAAEFFAISGYVDKLINQNVMQKDASERNLPDESFAWVHLYDNGTKDRYMPIRNSYEVKKACDYLKSYRDSFVYEDRVKIARRILKSGQLDQLTDEDQTYLYKQSGVAVGSAKNAAELLFKRAVALRRFNKDLEAQAGLAKAAEACLSDPSIVHSMEGMQKIARMIDTVDREYGLQKIESIGKAEDLFSFTIKQASDFMSDSFQLVTGSVYKKSDMSGIPADAIGDILGGQFLEKVSTGGLMLDTEKLAEELRILPRGDAKLFERLADSVNIKPLAKEASSFKESLSEMAEKHAATLAK
jgi:hypothetical protein